MKRILRTAWRWEREWRKYPEWEWEAEWRLRNSGIGFNSGRVRSGRINREEITHGERIAREIEKR